MSIPVPYAISAETLEKKALPPLKYEYISLKQIESQYTFARVGVPNSNSLFQSIAFLQFYHDYHNAIDKDMFIEVMKTNFFNRMSSQEWVKDLTTQQYIDIVNIMISNMNKYFQSILPSGWLSWLFKPDYTPQITMLIESIMRPGASFEEFCNLLPDAVSSNFYMDSSKIKIIVGESIEQAYSNYKLSIHDHAGLEEVRLISKVFGINIFIFGADGVGMMDDCHLYNLLNPSVMLYLHADGHWEPIVMIQEREIQVLTQPPESKLISDILEITCLSKTI